MHAKRDGIAAMETFTPAVRTKAVVGEGKLTKTTTNCVFYFEGYQVCHLPALQTHIPTHSCWLLPGLKHPEVP
jgi:hypothetical protein